MNSRFLLFLLLCSLAFAPPLNQSDYVVFEGGAIDIPAGSIIEGSVRQGGIQPDYVVDIDSEVLRRFLYDVRKLKKGRPSKRELIDRVVEFVQEAVPGRSYTSSSYRNLLREYRQRNENVPLSEYLVCSSAVCRENGLLLHFALKEVGIPNKHVYAYVAQGDHLEDHAFVVAPIGSKEWVFDSYNSNFNGAELSKLMGKGIRRSDLKIKVERIHNFPRVWIPKEAARYMNASRRTIAEKCSILFLDYVN